MKRSLSDKLAEAKDKIAAAHLDEQLDQWTEEKRTESLMLIGGIHVARKMSVAINAEVLKALAEFGEGGHYRALGFNTFAEFLDNSKFSPTSKTQFYERTKLLQNEGAETFDILNALAIPVRTRKLLGKGNVEVAGETIVIRDGENQEEIDLKDRSRLLETLSALADANAEKTKKLEKGETDFKKLKDKVRELEDAPASGGRLSQGEQLAGAALTSMAGLCCWIESGATRDEIEAFIARDLNLFALQYRRLFSAFEQSGLEAAAVEAINTDEQNRLAALLDDEED